MIRHTQLISRLRTVVLAGLCCASTALAEAPVKEQDVLDLFSQRERLRTEQQFARSYSAPFFSPVFDSRSLERQLWQNQWWLQQHKEPPLAGTIPYCQPPHFIPPPPFRVCPGFSLH